jgi:3-oxoacyl-[acyl-carrier protein] reductase
MTVGAVHHPSIRQPRPGTLIPMTETRDQRVSLVTGSARGLGLAVARQLRSRGDLVHVVWRSQGTAAEAVQREFGDRAHRADLLHPPEVSRLLEEVHARDGRLDVLVHAVGEYVSGSLEDLPPEELRRILASNTESAYLLFDAARSALRERGGRALFFGCAGLSGLRARRTAAVYAAAKSALLVLVRSWAVEEAPHGITVNMLSPGIVPHPDAHSDTHHPDRLARIPAGRAGEPDEIARAAAWLTSDEAAHVTGTDLQVAGGWML